MYLVHASAGDPEESATRPAKRQQTALAGCDSGGGPEWSLSAAASALDPAFWYARAREHGTVRTLPQQRD